MTGHYYRPERCPRPESEKFGVDTIGTVIKRLVPAVSPCLRKRCHQRILMDTILLRGSKLGGCRRYAKRLTVPNGPNWGTIGKRPEIVPLVSTQLPRGAR